MPKIRRIITVISFLASFALISLFTLPCDKDSTIMLISPDGEDISTQVEINVWVPTKPLRSNSEIYCLLNFDLLFENTRAKDVQFNCKKYIYIWIEIDPRDLSNYTNDFYLFIGFSNNVFVINLHEIFEG